MIQYICYIINLPFLFLVNLIYARSKNKESIKIDVANYVKRHNNSSIRLDYLFYTDQYFRNIFYNKVENSFVKSILQHIYKQSNLFCIADNTKLGSGIMWSHPIGTFLNAKSIGDNFSFRQNTTIGNKRDGRNDLIPTIGDNVVVGANVCIIGDVYIGNNVIIGAGCVVTKNVPDNTIVVGNPMKFLEKS